MEKTPWQIYKENKELAASAGSTAPPSPPSNQKSLRRSPTVMRGPFTTEDPWTGSDYDKGIESPAEQEFWDAYLGIKPPELRGLKTQHRVPPYRIDFALPDKKIGIEIDGYEYHSDKYTFTQDRQRERDLDLAGWRLIRFSGEEVFRYPDECVLDAARLVAVFQKGTRQ